MDFKEIFKLDAPPPESDINLDYSSFVKLFWKFKGMSLDLKRKMDFWQATNENLQLAYDQLDEQGRELESLYHQLQDDLQVAHQVQEALLPEIETLQIEGHSIAMFHKQLYEVGGDYYDVFKLANNQFGIGVFDISGHGIASSLIMGYLKAQFSEATKRTSDPGKLVTEVNDLCLPFFRRIKKYATVNFVRLGSNHIHYVSGGGYGYLVKEDQGQRLLKNECFLGLRQYSFQEHKEQFSAGNLLALYTDGIIEAQNRHKSDYTNKRLNSIILSNAHKDVDEILDRCLWDYRRFRQQDSDDIFLMLIRKEAVRAKKNPGKRNREDNIFEEIRIANTDNENKKTREMGA
jgi:sigma-B regulation protein RsbU (phosphoserine phosphatase)